MPEAPSRNSSLAFTRRILNHTVVRNTGFMYLVHISGYLFPLIALPYLSKVLSKETLGLVSHAQVFAFYFQILTDYGFNLTTTREIAVARDSPERINQIYSEVMMARLVLTMAGFLILCVAVLSTSTMRPHLDLYAIAFLSVVGTWLFPLWLYQGMEKMQSVALRDFLAKLLALAALVVFVRQDADYRWAAAAQSGGLVVAGIFGIRGVKALGVQFHTPTRGGVVRQLRAAWPTFLSLSVGVLGVSTNMFLLGLRSEVQLAEFAVAQRIIAAARGLVNPITTALYPHTSQKAARSEYEVILFVRKYAWWFAAPFLAGSVVLLVSAPWLIPFALGEQYRPSVLVIQIMALIPALFTFTQTYSTYYMLACGYDKPWMRIIIASTVINFVVLIPALFLVRGAVALALAGLATEASAAGMYALFYHRRAKEFRAQEGVS